MPFDETAPPNNFTNSSEQSQQPGETVGPEQFRGEDEPGPERNMRTDLLATSASQPATEPLVPLVEAESGAKIPVRYEGDSNYPRYTDKEGNQLATDHDISPGSPIVGPDYEHNPEKAHEMALAGADLRHYATHELGEANKDLKHNFMSSIVEDPAYQLGKDAFVKAKATEEEAGSRYDAEHATEKGTYITDETFDKITKALAEAQQLLEDSRSGKLREQAESESES